MPRLLSSFLLVALLSFTLHGQSSPVPLVNWPLVPASIAPGHGDFRLTVNGTGFSPKAEVRWNGGSVPTEFVSSGTLHAKISAEDVFNPATVQVTVVNPGTIASNAVFFQVRQSSPTVSGKTKFTGQLRGFASSADLNNDGKPDLLVLQSGDCGYEVPGTLQQFVSQGNGRFKALHEQQIDWCYVSNPVYGDYDGDGNVDLAIVSVFGFGGGSVIYLHQSDGTFGPGAILNSGFGEDNTEIQGGPADLNGDGKLDLVVASIGGEVFQAALGNGDGTFQTTTPSYTIPGGGADFAAIGDFNGDGKLDLAFADFSAMSTSF